MKKHLLLCFFTLIAFGGFAQLQEPGPLPSETHGLVAPRHMEVLPPLDMEAIAQQIAYDEEQGNLPKYGKLRPVGYSLNNSGAWMDLDQTGRLWQLRIKSENAKGVSLYFDEFHLPEGAKLFAYNKDRSFVKGAYTEANNSENGRFAIGLIAGEEVILEYFEPYTAFGEGIIRISDVGHAYRQVPFFLSPEADFGSSNNCEVNINCEEGDDWQAQKDAIVRISLLVQGDLSWCSGSLVNNTSEDWTPYILTAMHCGNIEPQNVLTTQDEIDQWIFYFNYEAPNCNNPSSEGSLADNSLTGATIIAHSNDGGGDTGSDFLLLELQNGIPNDFNPFFAGWDATGNGSASGVGIHHPAGDIKKISTYTSQTVSGSFGGVTSGTHWNVAWETTTNGTGVTEGGSSGSPLFGSNGRIIGDLTGGSSNCNSPDGPDEYGKISYSWESNGNQAEFRLRDWLDPQNTGVMSYTGSYRFPTNTPEITAEAQLLIYPNPVRDFATVSNIPGTVTSVNYVLIDQVGKAVQRGTLTPDAEQKAVIDVAGMPTGIYLLQVQSGSEQRVQKIQILD